VSVPEHQYVPVDELLWEMAPPMPRQWQVRPEWDTLDNEKLQAMQHDLEGIRKFVRHRRHVGSAQMRPPRCQSMQDTHQTHQATSDLGTSASSTYSKQVSPGANAASSREVHDQQMLNGHPEWVMGWLQLRDEVDAAMARNQGMPSSPKARIQVVKQRRIGNSRA
jgi:hypothetical protein